MSNLKHIDKRNSLANPKFYNYVRKYGMDALDFGCLLVTKNYLVMYSGFNLTPAEVSLLKSLTPPQRSSNNWTVLYGSLWYFS